MQDYFVIFFCEYISITLIIFFLLSKCISVPLKAICILTRSKENHIEKITKEKAYTMIVQQTYRSNNPEKMMKTLRLIDKLLDKIDLYLLGCNMDIEAAKIAYEGMK